MINNIPSSNRRFSIRHNEISDVVNNLSKHDPLAYVYSHEIMDALESEE